MKIFNRMALAVTTVALTVGGASAQTVNGFGTDLTCSAPMDIAGQGGELYSVVIRGAATPDNNYHYDLRAKAGGGQGGNATINGASYTVFGDNFTAPAPTPGTDAIWTFITYPAAAPGEGDRILIDSVDPGQGAGAGLVQRVGMPSPTPGMVVSGTFTPAGTLNAGKLDVDLGRGAKSFPEGGPAGILVGFSALDEVNDADLLGGPVGCRVGGAVPHPRRGALGPVIGYNVFRMQGDSGAPPVETDWGPANFLYFLPNEFDVTMGDGTGMDGGGGVGDGSDPVNDPNPDGDLAGYQNLDGMAYTGDDFILFSDTSIGAREMLAQDPADVDAATNPSEGYWYVVQPVVSGSVSDFTAVSIANAAPADLTMGTTMVDLDGDGSADFWSPQVDNGVAEGLGLTVSGRPLISAPIFGAVDPAASVANIDFDARVTGSGVTVTMSNTLESAEVAGYNVYRVAGDSRVKVNDELIGAEGGVYEVVDARRSSRLRRAAATSYEVEVVFTDGSIVTEGPFTVETTEARPSQRRGRRR